MDRIRRSWPQSSHLCAKIGSVVLLAALALFAPPSSGQPANDNFANRILLEGLPVVTPSVSLADATLEPGEPYIPFAQRRTVWWTWTSPVTGVIAVFALGSFDYPVLAFYTGNTVSNLTRIAGRILWPGGVFPVTVQTGTTYQIQADSAGNSLDNLVLQMEAAPSTPENDLFAQAANLNGTNLTVNADNMFASSEPGEPKHTPTAMGKSLWWKWTAPADGEIALSTVSEGNWVETALYTGTNLATLQKVGFSQNKIRVPLYAGVRKGIAYFIAADSVDDTYGPFTMTLDFRATPANDLFIYRSPLSTTPMSFDTGLGDAGREPREPILKGPYTNASGHTLWWTFTPPGPGVLQFSATTIDAFTYVSLGMFNGTNLTSLRPIAKGFTRIFVPVRVGVAYQILADPWTTTDPWGNHLRTLHILSRFYPVPTNNTFAHATELIGPSVAVAGNNIGATREGGEPAPPHISTLGASVWYKWTAPDSGWVYLTARSIYFRPSVAVYQGTRLGALRWVAAANPLVEPVALGFSAVAGTTYHIELDAVREEGTLLGDFNLELEFSTLRLTSPTNGASFDMDSPPSISINTPNPAVDGHLASVTLLVLHESLGELFRKVLTAPPFTATPSSLAPGQYVAVAIATNDQGRSLLSAPVRFVLTPRGDDFYRSITTTGYQWQVEGSVDGGSLQRGEPAHSGRGVNSSVWFQWVAPATGLVQISPSFPEAIHMEAFTGTKLNGLKRVSLTVSKSWNSFTYSFKAVAGTLYHFAVCHQPMPDAFDGSAFTFNLALRTVFITAPSSNSIVTDLSTVPVRIASSEPLTNITKVDYLLDGIPVASSQAAPFDVVLTDLRPGQRYLTARATMRSSLVAETARVPINVLLANDAFTNAIVLNGTEITTRASLYTATAEPGEPAITWPQRSAWWVWTAPITGQVWIDFDGTNTMPWVKVYTGPTINSLVPADSWARLGMNISHIWLNAMEGTTYHIALINTSESEGTLRLSLAPEPTARNAQSVTIDSLPALQLVVEGKTVKLTWPATANTSLESTVNLSDPGSWQVVPNPVITRLGQFELVLPLESKSRFFRLR